MLPSWRLAFNELGAKPGRTALIAGAVMLAAALVVAVTSVIETAQGSMSSALSRIMGDTDARIIHQGSSHFDDAIIETARQWPEVRLATGRLRGSATLSREIAGGSGVPRRATAFIIGVEFDHEFEFRDVRLGEGRLPVATGEALVDAIALEQLSATLGDTFEIEGARGRVEVTAVGLYERPSLPIFQRGLIFVDRQTVGESMGQADNLTDVAIIVREGVNVDDFCAAHADELPQELTLEPAERITTGFDRRVRASRIGFIIASALAFMAASFIIITGLTTAVTERQRELAVLRCVGAARHQLMTSQLVFGFLLSGIGAVIGIPVGIGLAAILIWYFQDLLLHNLEVSPMGVLLSVAGSLGAGLLGAIYPAWLAGRVSPLEAMTQQAKPAEQAGLLVCTLIGLTLVVFQAIAIIALPDAETRFWTYAYVGLPLVHIGYFMLGVPVVVITARLVSPMLGIMLRVPTDMLRRSLQATPYRHGFTAGALMVGLSVLVSSWSNAQSLLEDWLGRVRFGDGFAYQINGIPEKDQQAIAALPFVETVCPIGFLSLQIRDRQVFGLEDISGQNVIVICPDPDVFFDINSIEFTEGDPEQAVAKMATGEAVIVADRFLRTGRVAIGDTITLGAGRLEKSVEIVGAVNASGLELAIQQIGVRNAYLELSVGVVFMDRATAATTFRNDDTYALEITLSNGDLPSEDIAARITEVAPSVQYLDSRSIREQIDTIATTMLTINSVVAFAALFLACLGMGNVVAAGIHSRRYEFGVLRAVGAHRRMIFRLIAAEVLIVAAAAIVLGIALGLQLAWTGAVHYRALAGLPVEFRIPTVPILIGAAVIFIMAIGAATPALLRELKQRPSALLASGRNG